MRPEPLALKQRIYWVVAGIWLVAIGIMIGTAKLHGYRAEGWVPSLVCNLATTGLAILIVNVGIAELEKYYRSREEVIFKTRQRERVSRLMQNTASGLGLAHVYGVLVGLQTSVAEGLKKIQQEKETLRAEGANVIRRAQLYSHMLDAETLGQLDSIGSCLELLAGIEPGSNKTDDFQAGLIFMAVDGIVDGHEYLAHTFELPQLKETLATVKPSFDSLADKLRVGKKYTEEWRRRNGITINDMPPIGPNPPSGEE